MNKLGALLLIAVMALFLVVLMKLAREFTLQRFWDRHCMGIRWRRRFPDAPKADIREFLTILVDAFGYSHTRRTCFSPDDRVMDIYRAAYPLGNFDDNMELEKLMENLEERYGFGPTSVCREDITLGELYEHARKRAAERLGCTDPAKAPWFQIESHGRGVGDPRRSAP